MTRLTRLHILDMFQKQIPLPALTLYFRKPHQLTLSVILYLFSGFPTSCYQYPSISSIGPEFGTCPYGI
jgi:hypothetical protein